MAPNVIAESGFLQMVGGTLFAPANDTCNDNVYDYFVVSKAFAFAVVGTQRVDGVTMSPHRPVRLLLRGDARRFAVRKILRPAMVRAKLPHGPVVPAPSYEAVQAAAQEVIDRPLNLPSVDEDSALNNAMTDWYKTARTEFSSISGANLKYTQTRFRMEAALATTASPWAGESATSAFWRSLASRARDAAHLVAKPNLDKSQRRALISQMKSANRAILLVPKKDRDALREPLSCWTRSFVHQVSQHC